MRKVIAAYVPGLHQGYLDFFLKHRDEADELYVFPKEILAEIDHLRKDLRALDPIFAAEAVRGWQIFKVVHLLNRDAISHLHDAGAELVMPDEEISRYVGENYFGGNRITYDTVFLRRDKQRTVAQEPVNPDRVISCEVFDREMMTCAIDEGGKSSDWWRRVGAVLVRDGKILLVAHNQHLPTEHSVGLFGDSRSNFKQGIAIELSDSAHAEQTIISMAARRYDVSTDGASLYVTDFPCPPCAKAIGEAGIRKLYYLAGYSMMAESEERLRDRNVEIVRVQMENPSSP